MGMKLDELNFNKVFLTFSASYVVGALGNCLIGASATYTYIIQWITTIKLFTIFSIIYITLLKLTC